MLLIKSHSYTINLAHVLHIRAWSHTKDDVMVNGTRFMMKDNIVVQITCPYDEVIKQISNLFHNEHILVLDY